MKTITFLIAAAGMIAVAASQTAGAQPLAGNIGFVGEIEANSSEASTATEAIAWNSALVLGESGSFAAAGITNGESALFSVPWNFNDTTQIDDFWTVGGFTFNLLDSSIDPTGTGGTYPFGSVKVDVDGTASGNGYTAAPFSGTLTFADPNDGSGLEEFTAQWSFAAVPVPEPGTMALLGAALPALMLVRRKFKA